MARKSLIPAGSYLPAEEPQETGDPGLLARIVRKDAVKHGRRTEEPAEEQAAPTSSDPRDAVNQDGMQYDKSYGNMTNHNEYNAETNIDDGIGGQQGVSKSGNKYDSKESRQSDNVDVRSYVNTSGNTHVSMHGNTAGGQSDNMISHVNDGKSSLPSGSMEGQGDDGSSVRASIQATLQNAGRTPEILKTVTIKLAPSLDRRVEEHCFQMGRKKQEVVRDALLLYFEAIEEAQRQ